ncbi:polysaccharide deacetylase family protein [Micromonospora sp. MA102]|uniref:polysaccharide deacetylase family protein n=1 Tax=Micromonospora sp. MA102 TaxID=2952755 RepID=UPI0021C6840E|nr:polysaccharide deacetylase family protein [Micromonospora sp. MA102]
MTWKEQVERNWRRVSWPGQEAVALTIGVALEAFDNQSQLRLAGPPGKRDSFSLSYGEYGVRVGVWRMLELFDEYGVKASFSVSGRLAQDWPEAVAAVADAGHDIVGHGWVNDLFLNEADADAERDVITRTLDAIEQATGRRPVGWASPANSSSDRTKQTLVDAGITWSGDDAADDVPYVEKVGDGRLAILPKANLSSNDLIHWVLPANGPEVFRAGFLDTFATGHAEGLAGRPGWADMVLHCHMAGRPAFIPTLRACLDAARKHERVWWTTKDSLAAWTLEQEFNR